MRNLLGGVSGFLRKIPLVGGILAQAVSYVPAAAFAALGVIPVAQAAKFFARYLPQVDARIFYIGAGLTLAALVKGLRFLPISDQLRNQIAGGIVAATGAVAAYKHFTTSGSPLAGEYAALEYGDYGALGDYGSQYQMLYGDTDMYGATYQTLYGSTYQTLYGNPGFSRGGGAAFADASLAGGVFGETWGDSGYAVIPGYQLAPYGALVAASRVS